MKQNKDKNGHCVARPGHIYYDVEDHYSQCVPHEGKGLIKDVFKKVVKGARFVGNKIIDHVLNSMPNNLRQFLQSHGHERIVSLSIARVPINSVVKKIIDLASHGELEKNRQMLNYDHIYHLQIIINQSFILEKNSIIEVKPFGAFPAHTHTLRVPITSMTIESFIINAVKKIGPTIYRYNPQGQNCQQFVMNLLDSNNLNNPNLTNFILQDSAGLLRNVPNLSAITDAGALFDRLILGKGE
jgi:hypothetical protein